MSIPNSVLSQNLVPNPGFEEYNNIRDNVPLSSCDYWENLRQDGWGGSPDYFNLIDTVGLPAPKAFGIRYPNTGKGFAGMFLVQNSGTNYREYITVQLIEPLSQGEQYVGSFWYSASNSSDILYQYYCTSLDVHFSDSKLKQDSLGQAINIVPSVRINKLLNDTGDWVQLHFCYEAKGGEKFITIGNFSDDTNVNVQPKDRYTYISHPYIFIDDVKLENASDVIVDLQKDLNLGVDTTVCVGDTVSFSLSDSQGTFRWYDGTTDSTKEFLESGSYWIEYTLECSSFRDTIEIRFVEPQSDFLLKDTAVCDTITLSPNLLVNSATQKYYWNTGETSRSIVADSSGMYSLIVQEGECKSQDSTFVTLSNCNCLVHIPNAFSPNEDLINDFFSAVTECEITNYQLIIYTRWGEKIYESNQPWNGTYNDAKCQSGVYLFHINYTEPNGRMHNEHGSVTLVR
ncbi:MAG: gliding motility-associated C-terminal domain-containing protein [Bacteroidia bacterium]